jgi:uncharacterized protein
MENSAEEPSVSELCTACGICCSDAMFLYAPLKEGDRERLHRTAYPREMIGEHSLPLPCPMLAGTRCTIYADRPNICRSFRCEVLKAAEQGTMPVQTAFTHVREARALLAQLRDVMPEGVSLPKARERWSLDAGKPLDRAAAAAQLAFYAFNRYIDRHFRSPRKWLVSGDPEAMPDAAD